MTGAETILERYGDLDGQALLEPMITEMFDGRIALVSSFGAESAVLLHMVSRIDPATPVIFLDTGKLFAETLDYQRELSAQLGLRDVRVITPLESALAAHDPSGVLHQSAPDLCCHVRKVEPLERGLRGFTAWINGRKRFHGGEREEIATIERVDWRTKINPLARWTQDDLRAYYDRHDLPYHPLREQGYASIGCVPCTVPAHGTGDPRAGRWADQDKTECGIHWTANGAPIRVSTTARQ